MSQLIPSVIRLATTVAAASVIVSSNAFADDITAANTPFNAHAQTTAARPDSLHVQEMPADALKREYLTCERAAMQSRLDLATAAACSVLYEEVRERVFGGSFDALIAWWRTARDEDTATR